jgi:hypothetical protein
MRKVKRVIRDIIRFPILVSVAIFGAFLLIPCVVTYKVLQFAVVDDAEEHDD